MIEILPSILAADFARLGEQISSVEQGGASIIHVDIMDGHFVPNISLGPPVVQSIRAITNTKLDVHLMITDPDRFIPAFIESGANHILVHQETCPHLDRTLRLIKDLGAWAGVVVNPATPLSTLEDVLGLADLVLIMSVNPGFGGQELLPHCLRKVSALHRRRAELGLRFTIEIDGGVKPENLGDVVRAGCDWIVSGSSIFHAPNPGEAYRAMKRTAVDAAGVPV